MRIAIMQPYFIPYAGYFRLFQTADLFVVYDCVQFPRRGWLHRNQLPNFQNELAWFTLPLAKESRDILISELSFSSDAEDRMQEQFRKFPLFTNKSYLASEFSHAMTAFSQSPVGYIVNLLKLTCHALQIPFNIVQSSSLQLPAELKGQDRIIAIAKHFNADTYINAPGGRELYDENHFQENKIKLEFLPEYKGPYQSMLARLFNEDISILRNEILSQSLEL